MDISLPYTARDFSAELPAADYIARFRDAERIGDYCRACPNYGRSWGCPPFGFSAGRGHCADARALILPERRRLEQQLLGMERQYGGLSFAYVGTCLHCPEGTCTRPDGKPCRHPELVRPSLEACGFDIGKTTAELFGIYLKWGTDGKLPEYLTLVCGFFHNAGHVTWNG